MSTDPVQDYIAIRVPSDTILNPETFIKLNGIAKKLILEQFKGPSFPKAIHLLKTTWLVTSNWEEALGFQPDDGCPSCIAANEQMVAYLKQYPDRTIVLGNLSYNVFW